MNMSESTGRLEDGLEIEDSMKEIEMELEGQEDERDEADETMTYSSVPFPVSGTNWSDVTFLDQTEEERRIFNCRRNEHDFVVRGKTYLTDKQKLHTGAAVFRLVLSEFVEVAENEETKRHDHIASKGRIKKRIEALQSVKEPPEILVTNYQYPGSPPISQVAIFAACPSINTISETDADDVRAYKRLWREFSNIPIDDEQERLRRFEGLTPRSSWTSWLSDITWASKDQEGVYPISDFRNTRFKVIPRLVEGSWIAQATMPSNIPCVLGQKVQQRFFKGKGYMEVDVDIGSSAVACNIMSIIRGLTKLVKVEYALILQGENDQELCERVLACQDGDRPDFNSLKSLYDS